ncbi:MAG: DUF3240 family protein [Xanthomonadales bacterium]|jgi:hypothetical protein|nr:DUF3240 family protein [Xanthomonadales bacterium]
MSDCLLLVLLAPAGRRDDLVDALMGNDHISGFTLTPALGYSREHSGFSLGEQVAGYRDYSRFEVLFEATEKTRLLETLRRASGNERLRYWIMPVPETGHLHR